MFSQQQQTAANNIHQVFLEKRLRYAILKAMCQAGKTGAFQALINFMLREGTIQRAYILCGSTEIELRSQAIEDTKKANGVAYARGDIQVLFRQDFSSVSMDIVNTLIVVDESHLDQNQGQELDKFLRRHGLSMDGNPETMNAKNTFIVSVDATPYSELAALEHKETPFPKHIEELKPGDTYIGLADYLYKGNLKPTFDISREPTRFANLFGSGSPKYALVRLSPSRKGKKSVQESAILSVCRSKGYDILYYTAAQNEIAITRSQQDAMKAEGVLVPCLEDAPSKNTVVIIRGRLRAGKVVPKKHIAFVWEGAAASKTDALVQGLPGRMCGYYDENIGLDTDPLKLDILCLPMLFVPASALERKENKVVKSSEIERAILVPHVLPTKATNLKKPKIDTVPSNGNTSCVPIRIVLPEEDDDEYHGIFDGDNDLMRGELCRNVLLQNLNKIENSSVLTSEQKTEIMGFVRSAPPRVRNIKETNAEAHHNVLREVIKAYSSQTTAPNHILSQHDNMNFIITHPNLRKVVGANHRHLYIVFYTKASSGIKWVNNTHHNSRIPETNGRSVFSLSKRATDVPLVATGFTGFSEANLKSPEELEKALHSYITHWKTSSLTVSRQIQSNSNCFALSKTKFHFKDTKTNDVQSIITKLNTEFNIKMTVKYMRGSKGARGHFNVKEISW